MQNADRKVPRNHVEIPVVREEIQIVPDRKLGEQGIDCLNLDSPLPASALDDGGFGVVRQVRDDEGKARETFKQAFALLGSAKALQQLLYDEPRGEQQVSPIDESCQRLYDIARWFMAAQRERPDTGIDQDIHFVFRLDLKS